MLEFEKILDDLVCPRCKAQGIQENLRLIDGKLTSSERHYAVVEGVPDLRMDKIGATENYQLIHNAQEIEERLDAIQERMPALIDHLDMRPEEINSRKVLLAGSGGGVELALLSRFDPELIVALDYCAYIRILKASSELFHPRTIFIQGDLCNLPFKDSTFDYVINSGVMQHTRSPELAFRNLYSVLRRGGAIVMGHIYTPNMHNRNIALARNKYGFHYMNPDVANHILEVQARRYTRLCRWGLLRYAKRFPVIFGAPGEAWCDLLTERCQP